MKNKLIFITVVVVAFVLLGFIGNRVRGQEKEKPQLPCNSQTKAFVLEPAEISDKNQRAKRARLLR